jgi:transcriptional regulator with XRE-family HTH domain
VGKRKTSLSDQITILRGRYTLSQLAERFNISGSTIRRWQTGAQTPKPATLNRIEKRLDKAAESAKIFLRKTYHARASKKGVKYRTKVTASTRYKGKNIPKSHVVLKATRRKLKERDTDYRATGREYVSDWTNYDVRGWTFDQVGSLIAGLVKVKAYALQYIYQGSNHNPAYPRTRGATQPMMVSHEGIPGLFDELQNYLTFESAGGLAGRLLYVAAIYGKPSELSKKHLKPVKKASKK